MGQKNSITRRWAKRGTRPRAAHDQRTKWAYTFGAVCPKKGKGAGLVMPWCDTPAMAAHLAEISAAVDPGAHAVLMLDQAGWPTELPARELHLLLQMDDDEAGALQAATGSGPESVNVQRGPIFTSL